MLENVLPMAKDELFTKCTERLKEHGYSVESTVIKYSNFGAATSRRRLIVLGSRKEDAKLFFQKLENYKRTPRKVKEVIWHLRTKKRNAVPDHVWSNLKTIDKYRKYYETGKFGWYILKWEEPAPSFGNVSKTYILHPNAFNGGDKRVISVKEALLIMGFDNDFHFPEGIGLKRGYQMVADAVSPVFSSVSANVIKEIYFD
jgi:DNA (cytosine-5)-methyltransferase 1